MVSIARSRKRCSTSRRITRNPDLAKTWAMPLPIVPAPSTATVRMDSNAKFSTSLSEDVKEMSELKDAPEAKQGQAGRGGKLFD